MDYMGFGMQRWITTKKPRQFLQKSNRRIKYIEKVGGQDIKEYYHLKPNKLERLLSTKYSLNYRIKLKKELKHQSRKMTFLGLLILIVALFFIVLLVLYLSNKLNLF